MPRPLTSRPAARPTIVDVAARAGVSKSLVSLVLRGENNVSDEKRRLVLAAVTEMGYRPNAVARSLVRRRTNLVGIVLSDLHNPFFADVIDGVQAEASDHHYRTITTASHELPVVLVARRSHAPSVDSVSNDDPTGAALVVAHLAELGHRRIAHIDAGGGAGAAERRAGYEHAMIVHGLGAHIRIVPGSYTDEGGRHGVAALFDEGELPTAIFVANDLAAIGALSALAERGLRVPEDVSVVGYDNSSLAAVRLINLTTVDQPRPDMGRTAVRLLLDRMGRRRDTNRDILIPPTLVVRGTTAPPNPDR